MPAPKGHSFSVGNSGKPKKFKTPEELQEAINAYFDKCDDNTEMIYNPKADAHVRVNKPIPYTILGLCNVLGVDRKTLINYQGAAGYEKYFHIIKEAKNRIEQNKIEGGMMGHWNPAVLIFTLKNNHGYTDSLEVTKRTKYENMSDEEIDDEINRLEKIKTT